MTITLTSTTKIVELNDGLQARVWEGQTESGIPVHAFITRIAVHKDEDAAQFEHELQECQPPSADVAAYPWRMVMP